MVKESIEAYINTPPPKGSGFEKDGLRTIIKKIILEVSFSVMVCSTHHFYIMGFR